MARLDGRAAERARLVVKVLRSTEALDIGKVPRAACKHGNIVVVNTTIEATKVSVIVGKLRLELMVKNLTRRKCRRNHQEPLREKFLCSRS